MRNKIFFLAAVIACSIPAFTGCLKKSYYYADSDTPGTAIFSNTGNNVATCLFNNQPWRTVGRAAGGFYITELRMSRFKTGSAQDTLVISWTGNNFNTQYNTISLVLPVEKNFSWSSMSSFQGKRLTIDSTNGFFVLSSSYYDLFRGQNNISVGKGSIYFNTSYVGPNPSSPSTIKGRIAGLFEARFNTNNLNAVVSSGRFDDEISDSETKSY